MEVRRYDETPMQVTVPDVGIRVAVVGGGVSGAASVCQHAYCVRDVGDKDAGVCKLFQTETTHALRGKAGSADPAGVRYLDIISNPLTCMGPIGGVVHREGH